MHHQPLSANNTVLNVVTSKGENIIAVLTYLVQTMNHRNIYNHRIQTKAILYNHNYKSKQSIDQYYLNLYRS